MDKVIDKTMNKLYDKNPYPSIEFHNLVTNLQLFEDNIIKMKKEDVNFTRENMEIEFKKLLKKV